MSDMLKFRSALLLVAHPRLLKRLCLNFSSQFEQKRHLLMWIMGRQVKI